MSKKILVLTGGTRHGGNSEQMADAFVRGAQAAGHQVVRYDAGFKAIKGCIFCETCYKLGEKKACSHDDVFNELAPYYEWADALVVVTPLYWYTYTAQVKAALDKYYSLMVAKRPQPIKEAYLIACGAGKDDYKYDAIINTHDLIARDRGWENRGCYHVNGVFHKGDIQQKYLDELEEIGRTF
ncbi:MAG: flavodoxin family protein [Firmicutes bacterium]|nr:flavodoxin family protein [Bacillota bacterium]